MEFKPWAQWCMKHKLGRLLNVYVFLIALPVMCVAEAVLGVWQSIKSNWRHALKINSAINQAKKEQA